MIEAKLTKWNFNQDEFFNELGTANDRECLRLMIETQQAALMTISLDNSFIGFAVTQVFKTINGESVYELLYYKGEQLNKFLEFIIKQCKDKGINYFRFESPHKGAVKFAETHGLKFKAVSYELSL